MIAEIDTDAHYVYFVRKILSYVAFWIFNEFSFNICINSAFFSFSFFQLKHHKTKTNCTTKPFWKNYDNYPYKQHAKIHCSNFVQNWANLGCCQDPNCRFSSKLPKTKATTNQ